MGSFLTAHSRLEQLNIPDKWKTVDNQLYRDYDGSIYLCPRNTITDGYTIPEVLAFFAGSKMKWDTRASSQHDFECYYHKAIKVLLTEYELRKMGLLHLYNNMTVCEDIPLEFLIIHDTKFTDTNSKFLRMVECVQNIPKWRAKLMGYAVNFNVGWLKKPYYFDKYMIYKVNYGLLK